jgi:hypothetical protein
MRIENSNQPGLHNKTLSQNKSQTAQNDENSTNTCFTFHYFGEISHLIFCHFCSFLRQVLAINSGWPQTHDPPSPAS